MARVGQADAVVHPLEQVLAKKIFQLANVLAYCCGRYAQFLGRSHKPSGARCGLEGAQGT